MVQETTIKLSAATCIALGLSGNFTERDIELAVAEKDKTIGDLRKELETEREEKIKAFLSSARKDGRIDAKTEQNLLKLAKVDFPSVKEFVDSIEIKPSASLKDVTMKSTLSAERENWTYLDWMKKDSKGLERLKVENPTEFERLKSKFN